MKNVIIKSYSINTLILSIFILFSCSTAQQKDRISKNKVIKENKDLKFTKTIPIGANSWVVNNISEDRNIISKEGIHNWTSLDDVIRTYIRTNSGNLNVGFNMKSLNGESKIKVTVGNITKEITISNDIYKTKNVGTFSVPKGYNYIEIQGLQKSGTYIADISELLLGGSAITEGVNFVPIKNMYFGRRGPSVHMSYKSPSEKDVKWFYNEVTVPEGQDTEGSFFMANGHAQGYFGMQVNSKSERRILFSIWSAYTTDNPNEIPNDYKVTNLGNGKGVTVQDFGNEGSGKQSFKVFNWKAGTTYKFLLKGEPSVVEGSTDYTGYFYNPEEENWQLIASLRRPKTKTYLKRLHSFLENFIPSTGFIGREVQFGNQWVYDTNNTWTELTNARFTADATAANGDRFDYRGGVIDGKFFLKNCGFINNNTNPGNNFSRIKGQQQPNINFNELPKPNL